MDSVLMTSRRHDRVSRALSDNVCMGDVAFMGTDPIGGIQRLCHDGVVLVVLLAEYDNVPFDKGGQSPELAMNTA